ncbi:DUF4435 domain-containing protein [Paraglaciecola chathamensis]|uniref:DUF4435 domain-containing protein n=1 Tax=Paraglaciecola chathamensis TaxID=368405 RepID=UPI0026F81BF2|nr:DUF4435 domain-containing protein [Paraglaciecola chathamensis]MDO6560596.1 DUF4435 domain-containing protein [Paraglaciecola chathamensis]
MSSVIKYNPDENFRRLKRQKTLKFVIVEGQDDLPVYESVLSEMTQRDIDFDIFYSGGKRPIEKFLDNNTVTNSMFIVDKDFDDIDPSKGNIISLDRYSIENFFICEEVICSALQHVLKCKYEDARDRFSLQEFAEHVAEGTEYLVKVLFYYQRKVVPDMIGEEKVSWSDRFLCSGASWKLCENQIQGLINELLPSNTNEDDIESYFNEYFTSSGSAVKDFPGKMLKASLQRYIREQLIAISPKLNGKFNHINYMSDSLSSIMHRSSELRNILSPVVDFLEN